MPNDEIIEKYRYVNVDYDEWCEHIYEWFEEECKECGVGINMGLRGGKRQERAIAWAGFSSQGDGAAFSGYIYDREMDRALGSHLKEVPIFAKYIGELQGYAEMNWQLGHHNDIQWQSMRTEGIALYLDEGHPFADLWQEQLDKDIETAEEYICELVEELCHKLYRALEREYDALTSDEAVLEAIEANGYDKEVDDVEF